MQLEGIFFINSLMKFLHLYTCIMYSIGEWFIWRWKLCWSISNFVMIDYYWIVVIWLTHYSGSLGSKGIFLSEQFKGQKNYFGKIKLPLRFCFCRIMDIIGGACPKKIVLHNLRWTLELCIEMYNLDFNTMLHCYNTIKHLSTNRYEWKNCNKIFFMQCVVTVCGERNSQILK